MSVLEKQLSTLGLIHTRTTISQSPMMGPGSCGSMMVWDKMTSSCIVLPSEDMPMADLGHSYGKYNFDVNLMLSGEKWTLPKEG